MYQLLIEHGASVPHVRLSMRLAACDGHLMLVKALVARAMHTQADLQEALYCAISNQHEQLVRCLVTELGADAAADNSRPLMSAVEHRLSFETVKLLHQHGADLSAVPRDALAWYMYQDGKGSDVIIEYILQHWPP